MTRDHSLDLAIVGMSGRFPGAADPTEFGCALDEGRILLHRLTPDELAIAGVPTTVADDPRYVPVHGRLADADRFDNAFFEVSPREAQLLDPQQRLMLECAWTALEDAGQPAPGDPLRTGVYAAASSSEHLRTLLSDGELDAPELEEAILTNERDFLATRIAYKIGLTGPAMTVLTACSSSLVALHVACQALNNGECDQALVIAASVNAAQAGYLHMPGGVLSASGRCRPFDAAADGALSGSGVIGLVLRRYEDALDDRLPLHGIVLGSAVNNDGASKAGFLAPSAAGQEQAIRSAVTAADIDASSVGYLEMHGTGTHIGDPIEWAAASAAYAALGAEHIEVGALKATIGHLDAAAGLASVVKVLHVLSSGRVPAIPGLSTPNPLLDLTSSPLHLPEEPSAWTGPELRRGAVSSFGVGGTNAHVLLEQAPQYSDSVTGPAVEPEQLMLLSAADPAALARMRTRLANHLDGAPGSLADISTTLAARLELPFRFSATVSSKKEFASALRAPGCDPSRAAKGVPLIFLLPGQGTQAPGMAVPLAAALPGFETALEDCLRAFPAALAAELRPALYDSGWPAERVAPTRIAQPLLLAVEYAAGTALRQLGLSPTVLIGHSLGEVSAACLAGTLGLASAADIVAGRGELMQGCEHGAMLALEQCSEAETEKLIGELSADVSIAAVNSPSDTVVAGSAAAVDGFAAQLSGRVPVRRLRSDRAFHTASMDPAVAGLRRALAGVTTHPAEVAWIATLDASLVAEGADVDAMRFADAARHPVRFADALSTAARLFPGALAVEVGPGRVLSAMAETAGLQSVQLLGSPVSKPTRGAVLGALGQLWEAGLPLDRSLLGEPGRLLHLPGYPFHGPRWSLPTRTTAARTAASAPVTGAAVSQVDAGTPAELAAATEPGTVLRELWHEQLGDVPMAGDTDFFDLGGDSLSVARLARQLSRRFGVEVPVRMLLGARTIESQVALVEELLVEQILGEAGQLP